jgi:hypothetical protein
VNPPSNDLSESARSGEINRHMHLDVGGVSHSSKRDATAASDSEMTVLEAISLI